MGNEGNPQPSSGDILNLSGNDGVVMPPPPSQQSQPGVVEPSNQHHPKQRAKLKDLEGIRASQSFDDSVLPKINNLVYSFKECLQGGLVHIII